MILRDDRYITITMDEKKSLFKTCWKQASGEISDPEEVKSIITDICQKLMLSHPRCYKTDDRNSTYQENKANRNLPKPRRFCLC